MNPGDWVLFTGETVGVWRSAYVMRWTGGGWEPVPMGADASGMYMAAMRDLVHGAGDSIAARAFIGDLMAARAFIDNLLARLIVVREQGAIQSENFIEGSSGFRLKADGTIEIEQGILRGHFFAESLEAGPLSLAPSTPETMTRSFPAGTTGQAIRNSFGVLGIFDVAGSYGDTAISRIELVFRSWWQDHRISWQSQEVYINNRTLVAHTEHWNDSATNSVRVYQRRRLGAALSFAVTVQGKTVRLMPLPTFPQIPAESGTVYRRPSLQQGSLDDFVLHVRG